MTQNPHLEPRTSSERSYTKKRPYEGTGWQKVALGLGPRRDLRWDSEDRESRLEVGPTWSLGHRLVLVTNSDVYRTNMESFNTQSNFSYDSCTNMNTHTPYESQKSIGPKTMFFESFGSILINRRFRKQEFPLIRTWDKWEIGKEFDRRELSNPRFYVDRTPDGLRFSSQLVGSTSVDVTVVEVELQCKLYILL